VKTIYPETLRDLADRWTVLINRINQINRHEPNHYPDELWMYVAMLIRKRVATLSITHKFLVYFRKFC